MIVVIWPHENAYKWGKTRVDFAKDGNAQTIDKARKTLVLCGLPDF